MANTKRSLDPKAPDAVVFVTKKEAALSQIETAIRLWFEYGEPLTIHALAAAANEVYHGMGRLRDMYRADKLSRMEHFNMMDPPILAGKV